MSHFGSGCNKCDIREIETEMHGGSKFNEIYWQEGEEF